LERVGEPGGLRVNDYRRFALSPVAPLAGCGLGIEVDDERFLAALLGRGC